MRTIRPPSPSEELRTIQLPVARILFIAAALIPIVYTGIATTVFAVNTPFWDEWEHIPSFEKLRENRLTLSDLFAQQNEFRQLFPNIVFVVLGWLSKGDFRLPIVVSFLLVCAVSFHIYRLATQTLGTNPTRWLPAYVAANFLIFSPVQYYNWLQGQQLVYFVPIFCLTSCALIAVSPSSGKAKKFVLCGALCTIATFSSANGLLCWFLVLPLLITPFSPQGLQESRW